jgi:hypothetical protein
VIIPVFSIDDSFHVESHFLQLSSEGFESINLVDDLLRKLTLGGILDVSQEMLDTNLLGLCGSDGTWDMHELAIECSFGVSFFLSEIGLSGERNLLLVLNSDNDENRVGVVSTENFVDLDV